MSKPVFSLIAPSVRSAYYQQVYDSIARDAKVPFEFIFVGNVEPLKKIADNFHYINTNVKPAQCVEIAARNATGDFLIPIADDITFSDNFLNTILKNINSNPEKASGRRVWFCLLGKRLLIHRRHAAFSRLHR